MSEILEALFGSRAKTRLLRFFLLNSENEYSLQEVTQKNMISSANARKELNVLKKIKFVSEKSKKNQKYYVLNKEFPFHSELRSLVSKSNTHPQCKSLGKLKNIGDVKLALVSGIFLNYPKSKVDMVLVINNPSRGRLKSVMNGLEAEVGREISFMLMNSDEFKYRVDMLDRFLMEFLENPHNEVVNKIPGLKRIMAGIKKY